ncbi:ETX/MTX2 family pore-forming toxin [Chryseobacterium sp. 1B4]
MDLLYKNQTQTTSINRHGKEWWSVPEHDFSWNFIGPNNFNQCYMYNGYFKNVDLRPVDPMLVVDGYGAGQLSNSHAAFGYYLQDNLRGGDFKSEFLNKTYHDGYYYNLGIWWDLPLTYGVYNTGDPDKPWDFMYYYDELPESDISKSAASREPYKSWHPGLKSNIQGQYIGGENVSTYTNVEGDLVEIKSDVLQNLTESDEVSLMSEFSEQEEETVVMTNSTENQFVGGVTLSYEVSVNVLKVVTIKTNTAYKFEYSSTNSETLTTSTRKLNWYKTAVTVKVAKGKKSLFSCLAIGNRSISMEGLI